VYYKRKNIGYFISMTEKLIWRDKRVYSGRNYVRQRSEHERGRRY